MGSRSRTRGKQIDERDTLFSEREPYGAMFHCVYLSAAYLQSTTKAKALLFDLIYQHRGKNNGTLVLCPNEKDNKDEFDHDVGFHKKAEKGEAAIVDNRRWDVAFHEIPLLAGCSTAFAHGPHQTARSIRSPYPTEIRRKLGI